MDLLDRFFSRGLKLHHLRVLVMLGQWGQVRLVAQKLGVTQPAVSRQLAELEEGLGLDVVRRVSNGLVFTEAGQILLGRAREVMFQLEQARQELGSMSAGLRGEITIGAVPSVMQSLGTPLLTLLQERAPGVSINLLSETSDKLYTSLVNRTLHVLFSRAVPPQFADPAVAGELLYEDPLVIICSRTHPLAHKQHLLPQDLDRQPWVLPPTESPAFEALNTWMQENSLSQGPGSVRTTSREVYRSMLAGGTRLGMMSLGAALAPEITADFAVLALPGARFLPSVWMFHTRTEATSAVRAVVECAREAARGMA